MSGSDGSVEQRPEAFRPAEAGPARHWQIVGRWQEYAGEARTNLLRVITLGAFYTVELVNYHGLKVGPVEMPRVVDGPFHLLMSILAMAWLLEAIAIALCLRRGFFPPALKFVSTGYDLVVMTAVLLVADGPKSPLVVGYFVILAGATLRLDLPLVRFATAGAVVSYLIVVEHALRYDRQALVGPIHGRVIMVLAIVMTGVILGQVVRRVRDIAFEYAERLGAGRA